MQQQGTKIEINYDLR